MAKPDHVGGWRWPKAGHRAGCARRAWDRRPPGRRRRRGLWRGLSLRDSSLRKDTLDQEPNPGSRANNAGRHTRRRGHRAYPDYLAHEELRRMGTAGRRVRQLHLTRPRSPPFRRRGLRTRDETVATTPSSPYVGTSTPRRAKISRTCCVTTGPRSASSTERIRSTNWDGLLISPSVCDHAARRARSARVFPRCERTSQNAPPQTSPMS